jgi:TonB family protein
MSLRIHTRTTWSIAATAGLLLPVLTSFSQNTTEAKPFGGYRLLKEYIHEEIVYPPDALEQEKEGIVQLILLVDKTGEVNEIKVKQSVDPALDSEALRIIRKIRWEPATYMGMPIDDEIFYEIEFDRKKYGRICKERGYEQITYPRLPVDSSGKIYYPREIDSIPKILFADKKMTLTRFITDNIEYPPDAFLNDLSGTETIEFVVEPSGRLSNLQPQTHLGGGCCEEAVRLVKLLHWYPGIRDDRSVRVVMSISITFNLQQGSEYNVVPANLNSSL